MNFNDISLKILKANFRRYSLLFLCCSYSIMIFFICATVYTNEEFMNGFQSGMIASSIFAPFIGVMLFSVFFVLYAYQSFLKCRKQELGLFSLLGMTSIDIMKLIARELVMIAGISVVVGIIAGTVAAPLFYFIVIKLLKIEYITFHLGVKSYFYTVGFFGVVFGTMIVYSAIDLWNYSVLKLIKEKHTRDKNNLVHPLGGAFGLLMIGTAIAMMICTYKSWKQYTLLASVVLILIGWYICLSNISSLFSIVLKLTKKPKYRFTILVADLMYSIGRTKKVIFIISILAGITIFFATIGMENVSHANGVAKEYNPYNIAFVQLGNVNGITDGELKDLIQNSGVTLTLEKSLEFIKVNNSIYLSDQNISDSLGDGVTVSRGCFISLYQIAEDDGYEHQMKQYDKITIPAANGQQLLACQEDRISILFNRLENINYSDLFILNRNDYLSLKSATDSSCIGTIHLLDFDNWKHTASIYQNLSGCLQQYNREHIASDSDAVEAINHLYQPASRWDSYHKNIQAASFLLFLCGYVGILFFISSGIILHLKLLTEFEEEKNKFKKIYKIGIQKKEISKIVSGELAILFLLPVICSSLLALFYSTFLLSVPGQKMIAIIFNLIIGGIYLVLQSMYYFVYQKLYVRKLITNIME